MVHNEEVLSNLSREDKRLLVKVMDIFLMTQKYVQNILQGTGELPLFECHSTCRAIALHVQELMVVDGHYIGVSRKRRRDKVDARLRYCTHSWLVTPSGSIIDPYPVGILSMNPILIVTRGKYKSFGGGLYWPNAEVTRIIDTKELRERVKILSRVISEAQNPHLIF